MRGVAYQTETPPLDPKHIKCFTNPDMHAHFGEFLGLLYKITVNDQNRGLICHGSSPHCPLVAALGPAGESV